MPSASRSRTERTAARARFGLPRSARLIRRREFRRVYSRGRRVRGDALVVVAFPRRAPGHRIGLSVSKEHGGAVRRNKIKRLLREAFRLERPTLPGRFDMVLIPRRRDAKYSLHELRAELARLVARLATKNSKDARRAGTARPRARRGNRRGDGS